MDKPRSQIPSNHAIKGHSVSLDQVNILHQPIMDLEKD